MTATLHDHAHIYAQAARSHARAQIDMAGARARAIMAGGRGTPRHRAEYAVAILTEAVATEQRWAPTPDSELRRYWGEVT